MTNPFVTTIVTITDVIVTGVETVKDHAQRPTATDTVTVTATPSPSTPTLSSDTSSTASPATHTVNVGAKNNMYFVPPSITANVGDSIVFDFVSGNHTLVQASFDNPCVPSEEAPINSVISFHSPGTKLIVPVNTTFPQWFYCPQTQPYDHCHQGMVFALNPRTTGNGTFQQFQAAAEALGSSGSSSINPSSATAIISSGSTSVPSNTSVLSAAQSPKSISSNAIAGIIAGCIASLMIIGVVIYVLFYRGRRPARFGTGSKPRSLRILTCRNCIASNEASPPAYHTIYRTGGWESDRRSNSPGRSDLGLLSSPSVLSGSHTSSGALNGTRETSSNSSTGHSLEATIPSDPEKLAVDRNRQGGENSMRQEIDRLREEVLMMQMREAERENRRESGVGWELSRLPSYHSAQEFELA